MSRLSFHVLGCFGAVIGALVATTFEARAQFNGEPPAYVVTLPATVRSIGMAGAGVALVGHAGAAFSNPAGLATIKSISVEGSYRPAPAGGRFLSGAGAWRFRQFDFGVAGRYFNFGDEPAQFLGPEAPAGSYAREALVQGTVVYRYGLIAAGFTGRYARRSVDSVHVRGFTGDAGLAIAFFDIMALAFGVQNISGNWRSTALDLPRLTRLGFTMNYVDPQESFRLLSTFEVQWPEGRSARGVIGVEAGIVIEGVGIVGRAGYGGESAGLPNTKWSVGGTVTLGAVDLDYAYRARDLLDERAHHVGLRLTP
jgi:hypothetical protein